jgi:hypothetical protein
MRKATCGDNVDATADWTTCRGTNNNSSAACAHECDQELDLVCGTDGRTYINPCYLRVEACLLGVELAHFGPCINGTQSQARYNRERE